LFSGSFKRMMDAGRLAANDARCARDDVEPTSVSVNRRLIIHHPSSTIA
jgi:hypothetical protein